MLHLDFVTTKTMLLAKVEDWFLDGQTEQTKANALVALKSITSVLDQVCSFNQATLVERILPLLNKISYSDSKIIILYVDLLVTICNILDPAIINAKIIPELWKICGNDAINIEDFDKINEVIDALTQKVRKMLRDRIQSRKVRNRKRKLTASFHH